MSGWIANSVVGVLMGRAMAVEWNYNNMMIGPWINKTDAGCQAQLQRETATRNHQQQSL